MFRGSAPAKIDDKGRLKVPTGFLRILEESYGPDLFVTSVKGDAAHLYPLEVWVQIEERLRQMPSTDPQRQKYIERTNYFGQQVRLDAQGRILISQILREAAGLTAEVVINAQLDHLVVWNRERMERRVAEEPFTEDDFRALAERGI